MPPEPADRPLNELPYTDQIRQLTQWVTGRRAWGRDSTGWIHCLAEEVVSQEIGRHVLRGCAVELVRLARDHGKAMPADEDWRRFLDSTEPGVVRRVLAYVEGHRLRLDLKFRQLDTVLRRATEDPRDQLTDDALICALDAFAALGLRDPRADGILRRLVGLADYDQWCRQVQLHGLGVADLLGDQPDRVVELCDDMVERGELDSDGYYWRAYAQRRLGQFGPARESIDRALATLAPDRRESRAAYLHEWQVIRAAQQLCELRTTLRSDLHHQLQRRRQELEGWLQERARQQEEWFQQHHDELDERSTGLRGEIEVHSRAARQLVPDSVRGMVALLAAFAAVLSLAVILGTLAIRADRAWEAAVWVGVLLLAGTVTLAAMWTPVGTVVDRFRRRSSGGAGDTKGAG